MAQTVWKYPLDLDCLDADSCLTFPVPRGAKCLSVQWQGPQLALWVLVEPTDVPSTLSVLIAGTGHPIMFSPARHIDTFQMRGGALVFHAFEVTK